MQSDENVQNGDITFDGVPLKTIKLQKLRNQIGYVGQEPVLFNTTVKKNIQLGKPDATDAEIDTALRSTNAYKFVYAKEKNVNTFCGSGGTQLSGGEKQRIALARAFIKKPKVLIFDEATSALDKKNEAEVQQSIEDMKHELGSVTTIVIAHRLSTVRDADNIIVMRKGKKYEEGTHDELMAKRGLYFKLINTQEQADTKAADEEEKRPDSVPAIALRTEVDDGALPSSRPLITDDN